MDMLKWGIVSTGYIAERFADSMKHVDGGEAAAVSSRSVDKAEAFASKFGILKAYGGALDLARDPAIDIVYIATPNNAHLDHVMMMMDAGKHVLCEKPMGVNARQVEAMIAKAKETGVFFMEGMWTRFFPAVKQALDWVRGGAIGQPKALFANFGIDGGDTSHWKLQRSMGGGSMVDVGIYPLAMAFAAFGADYMDMTSAAHIVGGTDHHNTVTLQYPDGRIAVLGSSLTVKMENKVVISGTKGMVIIGEGYDWWRANRAELILSGDDPFKPSGEQKVFEQPYPSVGFQYEAQAVQDYIRAGKTQADEITWAQSLQIAQTLDKLRAQWGVVYDEDK